MRTLANQGLIPLQHQHAPQPQMAAGVGDFQVMQTAEGPVLVPVQQQISPGMGQVPAPAPSLLKSILVLGALAAGGVYVYKKYIKPSGFFGLSEDDPAYEPRHRAKRSRSRVLAEVDRLLDSVESERRSGGRRALPPMDDDDGDES